MTVLSNDLVRAPGIDVERAAPLLRAGMLFALAALMLVALGFPQSDAGAIISAANIFVGP